MSCVIASKRKEGVKQRGLPVERIYPMLEFEPIKQVCGFFDPRDGAVRMFRRCGPGGLRTRFGRGIFPAAGSLPATRRKS